MDLTFDDVGHVRMDLVDDDPVEVDLGGLDEVPPLDDATWLRLLATSLDVDAAPTADHVLTELLLDDEPAAAGTADVGEDIPEVDHADDAKTDDEHHWHGADDHTVEADRGSAFHHDDHGDGLGDGSEPLDH